MLYAITDRRLYAGGEGERRARLLEQTSVWATHGVGYVQMREKDLYARDQVELARAMIRVIRKSNGGTRLLVNGRPDVALAAGADGVHLPSGWNSLTPTEVREIFSGSGGQPYISVACHTLDEVEAARERAVDAILFAPVFEKIVARDLPAEPPLAGSGLAMLEHACRMASPAAVFALGGVTAENAALCRRAGAAGVAGIRLMQQETSAWANLA